MMAYYAALFTGFFLLAMVIRINRKILHGLAEHSVALVNDLISAGEDDVKIRQMQQGTRKLVTSLGKTLLLLVAAIAAGGIPVLLYALITVTGYHDLDLSSFYAILTISLGATAPFLLPYRKTFDHGYSELSRLLHRMALDNYTIGYKLFRREVRKLRKKRITRRPDFVVISGLARAGTTSLMNDLARIDRFVSLSYANMPFLMCPNTWAKFYRPKRSGLKERSHKDGIMIGLNSNEALEEYFFKVKADDGYIVDGQLNEYGILPVDYSDYLDYQAIIRKMDDAIYLTKNNNFLLRYQSIREYNDEFIFVILHRYPLTHAASLLEKHREYKKQQAEDPFVLEYMDWLGHHEFGLNRKRFVFSTSEAYTCNDPEKLDYWLEAWIDYYQYALTIEHPNTLFIHYDDFCRNPKTTIEAITGMLGMDAVMEAPEPFKNRREVSEEYSEATLETARSVYTRLCQRSNTSAIPHVE